MNCKMKIITLFLIIIGILIPNKLKPDNKKIYTIYMVLWRGETLAEKGFKSYFKENKVRVKFIIKDCKQDKKKLKEIINDIRKQKPDLIYTFGTTVTKTIAGTYKDYKQINKNYITDIPIVFNIVANPVKSKIVESRKSSNRKVTGTSHLVPYRKQISTMKAVHKFNKLGVIYNPKENNSNAAVESLKTLSKLHKYKVIEAPIHINKKTKKPDVNSIPLVIKKLLTKKPQLVYIPSDSFIISNAKKVVSLLNKYKIPSFSATEGPIRKAGALFGLVSKYFNVGKFAGYKAEAILVHNKHPKDIPIERLERFTLLININTARKLKFYPPIEIFKFAEIITNDKSKGN